LAKKEKGGGKAKAKGMGMGKAKGMGMGKSKHVKRRRGPADMTASTPVYSRHL